MKWILGIVVFLLLAISAPFLLNQDTTTMRTDQISLEPQGGGGLTGSNELTISEINRNYKSFIDSKVVLEGEIDAYFSQRIFRLDQEATMVGDEILVVSRKSIPDVISENSKIQIRDADNVKVKGTIKQLIINELERELNIDLDPKLETAYEGHPILVADEVIKI